MFKYSDIKGIGVTIQGFRFLKYLCFVDPLNHGDGSSDFLSVLRFAKESDEPSPRFSYRPFSKQPKTFTPE